MSFPIPPDTRAVGTGNPPTDMNNVADVLSLVTGTAAGGSITPASASILSPQVTTGTTASPLNLQGSTNAGQMAFIKQTGTTDHAATIYLSGVGGTTNSALNVVSDNTGFSALQVSGTETGRGTIKIAHKGQSAGTDSSAAAISIDLQTTVGGSTGTAAQGIFITSTTDAAPAGNALTVRYNTLDQFVIKSNGLVAIGNIAIGHTPAGQLEIAPKDASTVGLFIQAFASGTDIVSLKDSGGNQRFQINNAGNMVARANSFFTTPVLMGGTSSDAGGGGGGCLTLCHNTDPTTNPASGHAILYVDASGNLLCRTSAGNVRTVAAV